MLHPSAFQYLTGNDILFNNSVPAFGPLWSTWVTSVEEEVADDDYDANEARIDAHSGEVTEMDLMLIGDWY